MPVSVAYDIASRIVIVDQIRNGKRGLATDAGHLDAPFHRPIVVGSKSHVNCTRCLDEYIDGVLPVADVVHDVQFVRFPDTDTRGLVLGEAAYSDCYCFLPCREGCGTDGCT